MKQVIVAESTECHFGTWLSSVQTFAVEIKGNITVREILRMGFRMVSVSVSEVNSRARYLYHFERDE